MSKQYNKLIKRRRRTAYLARRKKALAEAAPKKTSAKAKTAKAKRVSKSVPKRPTTKVEPTIAKSEVKASDKATAADVLGPDSEASKTPKAEVKEDGTPSSSKE
jgi:hypothetical protein